MITTGRSAALLFRLADTDVDLSPVPRKENSPRPVGSPSAASRGVSKFICTVSAVAVIVPDPVGGQSYPGPIKAHAVGGGGAGAGGRGQGGKYEREEAKQYSVVSAWLRAKRIHGHGMGGSVEADVEECGVFYIDAAAAAIC